MEAIVSIKWGWFEERRGNKKGLDSQSTWFSGALVRTCGTGSFRDHKYLALLLAGSLFQVALVLVALPIRATHRHIVTVALRNKDKRNHYGCYWIRHPSDIPNTNNHFQNKPLLWLSVIPVVSYKGLLCKGIAERYTKAPVMLNNLSFDLGRGTTKNSNWLGDSQKVTEPLAHKRCKNRHTLII